MATADPATARFQILTPNSPSSAQPLPNHHTIFLAGPTAIPWREPFLALLAASDLLSVADSITIFDPMQPKWDSTWIEDYAADANFRAQTDWELARLATAHTVVVYFDANNQAPVSLLELGLVAQSGRAVVACQRGFWKRGNVEAVCARLGVPLEEELEGLVKRVVERVKAVSS